MKRANVIQGLWFTALISGAIGILGHYDLVIIKYISDYDFELLLLAFCLLLILRTFKK